MRIAMFSEVYWPMISGVSTTLTRTADALIRRGHQLRVYSAAYPLGDGMADRPEVHRSPGRTFFLSPEVQWAAPDQAEITADLARFRPDLVHLATEFAMGYAGLRAARAIEAPIIASAHTDYERYAGRYGMRWAVGAGWLYLRWFYRHAHRVLTPSASFERHLRNRGIEHTGIWTRGVDADQFSPSFRSARYRQELGIGPDDLLVGYVGRIAPEKGVERLLDAWKSLAPRYPRAHLVFTGQGLMEPEIRRRALPRVHLTGMKRGIELATAYASADVFAMPSVTETFGNVTLEAMSAGVAPVAMAAGGIGEFGIDGVNVLLADPDQDGAFRDALDRLLGNPALRRDLARGARTTALGRSWGPIYDRLVASYADAAAAGRSARAA